MRSLRINIEDAETSAKLDILLSLFGDDIEVITLREGNEASNKGDNYENLVAQLLSKKRV